MNINDETKEEKLLFALVDFALPVRAKYMKTLCPQTRIIHGLILGGTVEIRINYSKEIIEKRHDINFEDTWVENDT